MPEAKEGRHQFCLLLDSDLLRAIEERGRKQRLNKNNVIRQALLSDLEPELERAGSCIRALIGGRSSAWCRLSAGPEKHRRGQVQRRGRRCQGCDAVAQ